MERANHMKDNFRRNYILVQGWMLTDLPELKGNELLIYALIYGLAGSENRARLSYNQIAKMLHITRKQVMNVLSKLEEDQYIKKVGGNLEGEPNEKNMYSIQLYATPNWKSLYQEMGKDYTTLKIKKEINKNIITHKFNKRDIVEMSKSELLELAEEYKQKYQAIIDVAKHKWIEED